MFVIGLVVLVLLLPSLLSGWSTASNVRQHGHEVFMEADKGMRETHRKMAREGDYAIGANGMINTTRYSDGSKRYGPDGGSAPKGKYF